MSLGPDGAFIDTECSAVSRLAKMQAIIGCCTRLRMYLLPWGCGAGFAVPGMIDTEWSTVFSRQYGQQRGRASIAWSCSRVRFSLGPLCSPSVSDQETRFASDLVGLKPTTAQIETTQREQAPEFAETAGGPHDPQQHAESWHFGPFLEELGHYFTCLLVAPQWPQLLRASKARKGPGAWAPGQGGGQAPVRPTFGISPGIGQPAFKGERYIYIYVYYWYKYRCKYRFRYSCFYKLGPGVI